MKKLNLVEQVVFHTQMNSAEKSAKDIYINRWSDDYYISENDFYSEFYGEVVSIVMVYEAA